MKESILSVINSNALDEKDLLEKACAASKRASSSIEGIQDQISKQKALDEQLRDAGIQGKRSLIKNFMLRNDLVKLEAVGSSGAGLYAETNESPSGKTTLEEDGVEWQALQI